MHRRSLGLNHGDTMGITTIVITSVFLGLAAVAVGIRIWSRKIQRHSLVLNDYAAMLAWIFAASLVIFSNIVMVQYGSYQHMDSETLAEMSNILKAYIAADAIWAAANTSIKISIVHFYITIFRSNKMFLKFAYAVMAFVSAFGAAIIISDVLTCRPLSKEWNPLESGVCERPLASLIALSSCNMATDLIIILLPMPMVWRLHMATHRKIELTIIFALGFIVCIVTLIRLILSTQVDLEDYTYSITRITTVTLLEPLLGIIIACLPIFPPAIKTASGYMRRTHPKARNVLSSSMARLHLKRPKNSAFPSSDDSAPLTDLEAEGTQNHITGPSGKPEYVFESYGKFAGFGIPPPNSSIRVKHDLVVRSDDARDLEVKL